jgi:exodeoxyribonuclease V gamma subunit
VVSPVTFLSNRLENLLQGLSEQLFSNSNPFSRRLIIVPTLAMKSWLTLMLANQNGIAFGIEICLLNQAIKKLSICEEQKKIPTHLEMALACEVEIQKIATSSNEEKAVWKTILDYLKFHEKITSKRSQKRLISLADHLATLFMQYDIYGHQMVEQWGNEKEQTDWQAALWCKLYESHSWMPTKALTSSNLEVVELYIFGFSHLSTLHRHFFNNSNTSSIHYYQLSPCQLFWSDIQSDKEQKRLRRHRNASKPTSAQQQLDLYLRENNALLANFGRIGREMALAIEQNESLTEEHYLLPNTITAIPNYSEYLTPDTDFYQANHPFTLLDAIQADLLLLRNHRNENEILFETYDQSIQIHVTPSKKREIEILYHNLLRLIEQNHSTQATICPQDIIVMASNIVDYEPYIKQIFGSLESQLDFQIMDLSNQSRNVAIQSIKQLLDLGKGRWDAFSVLTLFENPLFQKRHELKKNDVAQMRAWLLQAEISWGESGDHRNEILHREHCSQGIAEKDPTDTWQSGFKRLIHSLIAHKSMEEIPFSQAELMGTFVHLFNSLRDDLSCLQDGSTMPLADWITYLKCLFNAYFSIDSHEPTHDDTIAMMTQIDQLNLTGSLSDIPFSYQTIEYHLHNLFNQRNACYRENHLQAVRFCSMLPMRAIPAKVICLLGMDEEAFPRKEQPTSLDRLQEHPQADYKPTSTDFDRYLFLEALLSTRHYLLISYSSLSEKSTEIPPSLLVTELLTYMDEAYDIQGKKISEYCIVTHPFHAFDCRYFQPNEGNLLHNYSNTQYRAAQAHYRKKDAHQLFPELFHEKAGSVRLDSNKIDPDIMSVAQLSAFAKNPLKAYFNHTLGIHLEDFEAEIRTEERFILNALENYQIRQAALAGSVEEALERAERAGKLPMGTFKEMTKQQIGKDIIETTANLKAMGINFSENITIELHQSCRKGEQIAERHWIVPAFHVEGVNGIITFAGTLQNIAPQGLIVTGTNDVGDLAKHWPQFLLLCCVADHLPFSIQKQFLPIKENKPTAATIKDPYSLLQTYCDYYHISLKRPSLLLPEWLADLLAHEPAPFIKRVYDKMNGFVKPLYNPYIEWLVPRGTKIVNESLVAEWKEKAHELYEGKF